MAQSSRKHQEETLATSLTHKNMWSTQKLKAEISSTLSDLKEGRALELAARIQTAGKETLETTAAIEQRRDEVSRLYRRYIELLDELERRGEAYP